VKFVVVLAMGGEGFVKIVIGLFVTNAGDQKKKRRLTNILIAYIDCFHQNKVMIFWIELKNGLKIRNES
jgi:hypothetical protein